jgi:UDP-2,3-diacylglucosamine hydrolase
VTEPPRATLDAPTYVISDVHLCVATPRRGCGRCIGFLRALPGARRACSINGDLFDFWFEWRRRSRAPASGCSRASRTLVDAGVPVTWIAGNHDCWGGDVLREDVGATYHFGSVGSATSAGGARAVEHGDGPARAGGPRATAPSARCSASALATRPSACCRADVGSRLATGSSQAKRTYRPDGRRSGASAGWSLAALEASRRSSCTCSATRTSRASRAAASGGVYANAGSWLDAPDVPARGRARDRAVPWDGSAEGDRLDVLERRAEEAAAIREKWSGASLATKRCAGGAGAAAVRSRARRARAPSRAAVSSALSMSRTPGP